MHRCSCPPLLSGVHGWRGFPTRSKYGLVGLGYCPRGTPPSETRLWPFWLRAVARSAGLDFFPPTHSLSFAYTEVASRISHPEQLPTTLLGNPE